MNIPFELGRDFELWHSFYEPMHFRQMTEIDVLKALMPQHLQSWTVQGSHGKCLGGGRRELWEVVFGI